MLELTGKVRPLFLESMSEWREESLETEPQSLPVYPWISRQWEQRRPRAQEHNRYTRAKQNRYRLTVGPPTAFHRTQPRLATAGWRHLCCTLEPSTHERESSLGAWFALHIPGDQGRGGQWGLCGNVFVKSLRAVKTGNLPSAHLMPCILRQMTSPLMASLLQLKNGNNSTSLMRFLQRFHEWTHVKNPGQYLTHSKCSVNKNWCCYYLEALLPCIVFATVVTKCCHSHASVTFIPLYRLCSLPVHLLFLQRPSLLRNLPWSTLLPSPCFPDQQSSFAPFFEFSFWH